MDDDEAAEAAQEEDFDKGQFPSASDATKAMQAATKEDVERPRPYAGATEPCADIYAHAQRGRMQAWLAELQQRAFKPTHQQRIDATMLLNEPLGQYGAEKMNGLNPIFWLPLTTVPK